MADDDDCARIARDVIFEPQGAFEVEIVGGFVEQEDVRFGEQHRGERDAHAPAAGEFRAGALLVGMGEAEPGEDRGCARRRGMGPDVGQPRLDLGDAVRVVGDFRLGDEVAALAVAGEHDLDQAFRSVGCFLGQPADGRARRARRNDPARARGRRQWRGTAWILPVPLRPTRPTRAPEGICAVDRSIKSRPATRREISSITSIGVVYGRNGGRDATDSSCCGNLLRRPVVRGTCCTRDLLHGARVARTGPLASQSRQPPRPAGSRPESRGMRMCIAGCERAVREAMTRRGFFTGAAARRGLSRRSWQAVLPPRRRGASPRWSTSPTPCRRNFRPSTASRASRCSGNSRFKKDGYNLNWWRVSEHVGTHMDAPIPFLRARRDGGQARDRATRGAARGRRHRLQGRAGSRLPAVARRSRRVGDEERPAAGRTAVSRSTPAGASFSSTTKRNSPVATSTARSTFRASIPTPRSG